MSALHLIGMTRYVRTSAAWRLGCRLATTVAVALASIGPRAATLPGLALNGTEPGPITLPLFAPGNGPPSAVVQIDSLRTEFQRKGFFRIGVLPVTIAEGVTVELRDPAALAQAVRALPRTLPGRPAGAFEGRRFELRFPRESTARLTAERVVFRARGTAALQAGCWTDPEGRRWPFTIAMLEPGDGTSVWLRTDAGRWLLNPSSPTPAPNPEHPSL